MSQYLPSAIIDDFANATDTSKKFSIDLSSATTGTKMTLQSFQTANRIMTFPDATTTIVGTDTTQTLSNKNIDASVNTISNVTTSNVVAGSIANVSLANSSITVTPGTGLSGGGVISLGGAATINLANTAVTIGTYGSATLSPIITVDAQGRLTAASTSSMTATNLLSATTTINIGSAAAPTVGQVLTATSGTTATWQNNPLGTVTSVATGVGLTGGTITTTGTISLVIPVTIANGGTNSITALNNNRIMISSGGAIVETAAMTNGQILIGSTGLSPAAATITGTVNQITVTGGAGTITLSLPQNIHTAATPTFASETLTAVTNQIVLGTTRTITLTAPTPATASRVYTIPDAGGNDTFVLLATAQTLTNKNITGTTNTVSANSLKTTGAVVVVSAAAPPTTGQALVATSATTATWQSLSSFSPVFAVFYSVLAVAVTTTVGVGFASAEPSNTAGITSSGGTNTTITINTAGTYSIAYGIWNTVSTSATYIATQNGVSIANSRVSSQDTNSMTTMTFNRTFAANDTVKIVGSATITNAAPGGTASISAYIKFGRIA